jgi:hypothetical protein
LAMLLALPLVPLSAMLLATARGTWAHLIAKKRDTSTWQAY